MMKGSRTTLCRRLTLGALAAALVGILVSVIVDDNETERSSLRRCNIDPADGEVAISAAIESCPDGSIVGFPFGRRYHQANRILVRDRNDLTIDGNGSTFTTSFVGRASKINGNWLILRGRNIRLMNMTSVGTFTYTGERSLARISPDPNFSEANPNYGLYGVDGVELIDVNGYGAWGDGVTTGPDTYEDGSPPDYTRNVLIKRMHVEKPARMCWGPTSGINISIEDSSCKDAWYGGVDAEIDNPDQPLQNLRILRNTFDGYNTLGVFVPVAAANAETRDIAIRDNRFLTPPDQKCSAPIHIGGYPDSNPAMFRNVITEGNELKYYSSGVVYDHVDHGTVNGNTLTRLTVAGFTPEGLCGVGKGDPIRVTNSRDVAVGSNTIQ